MSPSRRDFLRHTLLASAALALSPGIDRALAAVSRGARLHAAGHGPLVPDPQGLLDLPAGFSYRALSPGALDRRADRHADFRSRLTDGTPTPPLHDGMAAFAGASGLTVLVRNHELNLGDTPQVDPDRTRPYDPMTGGGTTTLWVDRERQLTRAFASLSGTLRNCAGGRTPWGSWLSCEETTAMPGEVSETNADRTPRVSRPHGYVFEVDARATALVEPTPLRAMGRFYHEAVAIDPSTGICYLTEDRDDGLLYRFRPAAVERDGRRPRDLVAGDYARGGVLEALRVRGRAQWRTQNWVEPQAMAVGERLPVEWVRIPDVEPDMDTERDPADTRPEVADRRWRTAAGSVRGQGFSLGCAQFARGEGAEFANGRLYVCCTNGGPERAGQVFRLDPRRDELTLLVQPDDRTLLDGPDNLCVAPHGDLVVCEDGRAENRVVGLTREGRIYPIAQHRHAENSEFAGATFSPDGETLFFNLQSPGVTFAVWGPWSRRRA